MDLLVPLVLVGHSRCRVESKRLTVESHVIGGLPSPDSMISIDSGGNWMLTQSLRRWLGASETK